MSQLQTVLRRSVAHLDPSDHDGRERMFTNAREAMIRLLWSYDPPLTPKEIDSKIEEFDTVVSAILQEEPDSEAEPADGDGDERATSSLITPEPDADETLESETGDTAEPASFSAGIALPPREPIRKLARFQPLSQIGSPTPGKPDTNKTSDAIPSPAVPDANAAAIAALAAFDNMVGSERSAASAAGTVAARSAVHIGGETRSTPSAVYRDEDDSDTDAVDSDEGSSAEDTLDDLLFHVRDDELPPEDADDNEGVEDEEAVEDDLDDDASQHPDDEAPLDDDDQDADSDASDRLSAEDVLRHHRERFEDSADEPLDAHDDRADEPFDENPLDADEEEPRRGLGERLRELTEAISGRMIGILAGIVLLLAVGGGGAVYLFSRSPTPASTASRTETSEPASTPAPARPTDIAGMIEAEPETPVPDPNAQPGSTPPEPRTSNPQPAPEAAAGALALETLNLFDGRDPSVFQSAPANPVRFEGDTQGGFARVSSSTNSTGSRITVGRGVYERLAGRTIRIVVVARAAKTNPTNSLRFAYQNGRSLSPWHDGALGPDYAPLSTIWTVPKDRGGPETDAVLIEPGIPGDGTAADIKSVRIEVLK